MGFYAKTMDGRSTTRTAAGKAANLASAGNRTPFHVKRRQRHSAEAVEPQLRPENHWRIEGRLNRSALDQIFPQPRKTLSPTGGAKYPRSSVRHPPWTSARSKKSRSQARRAAECILFILLVWRRVSMKEWLPVLKAADAAFN